MGELEKTNTLITVASHNCVQKILEKTCPVILVISYKLHANLCGKPKFYSG